MTAVAQASGPSSIITFRVLPARTVGVAAFVAVVCRLPFLHRALGADEAGFLMVGRQWNGSGTSLYGNYWVDRPPLLVTIFRIAAAWGGMTALRLIGCLAVVLLVWGTAWTAHAIGGVQAGRWAAICAAALCVSPLLGSYAINGELLAAPFVVFGLGCVVVSLRSQAPRQAFAYA
ncbi:MAG: hypothetical protein JWP10_50, partial [Nocardioidaceae bacterium]|nr:hypothetical protein [Nocardioidaceae bacterium]